MAEWKTLVANQEGKGRCGKCGMRRTVYRLVGERLCLSCSFERAHARHSLVTRQGVVMCNLCHLREWVDRGSKSGYIVASG